MENPQTEELVKLFKTEVNDRSEEVDPNSEEDWFSLSVGWGLAKGLSPEQAREFAIYLRYSTDLG